MLRHLGLKLSISIWPVPFWEKIHHCLKCFGLWAQNELSWLARKMSVAKRKHAKALSCWWRDGWWLEVWHCLMGLLELNYWRLAQKTWGMGQQASDSALVMYIGAFALAIKYQPQTTQMLVYNGSGCPGTWIYSHNQYNLITRNTRQYQWKPNSTT